MQACIAENACADSDLATGTATPSCYGCVDHSRPASLQAMQDPCHFIAGSEGTHAWPWLCSRRRGPPGRCHELEFLSLRRLADS
jgi:hypothetical protein